MGPGICTTFGGERVTGSGLVATPVSEGIARGGGTPGAVGTSPLPSRSTKSLHISTTPLAFAGTAASPALSSARSEARAPILVASARYSPVYGQHGVGQTSFAPASTSVSPCGSVPHDGCNTAPGQELDGEGRVGTDLLGYSSISSLVSLQTPLLHERSSVFAGRGLDRDGKGAHGIVFVRPECECTA